MFENREQAGEKLAEELQNRGIRADLVLAIPRGGLPLGRKVADVLDTELDVVVAQKIGAPDNPELAIGAVASDGSYWLNEDMIQRSGIQDEFVEQGIEKEKQNAREKLEFMREEAGMPEIKGKDVIVVDDGVATGATAIACLRQLRNSGVEKVILAVPVGPEDTEEKFSDEADKVILLENPSFFGSVGSHYKNFGQVSDEEARKYLD